jgi:tetraacyldisaccharide 4'-kinase
LEPRNNLSPLFYLGLPLVPLYFLGWKLRIALYRREIIPQRRLGVKVISVGNLTVGGSGKTPLALYLVQRLKESGYRPAVLSRGFGRKGRELLLVKRVEKLSPKDVGDEPYLLAKYGVPILVGKDRFHTGRIAQTRGFSPLILDDGFQYLSLYRDVDILIIDSSNPWGNGLLLPAGHLREPLGAVRRAHIIILNRADQAGNLGDLKRKLLSLKEDIALFEAVYLPQSIHWLGEDEEISLRELRGKGVYALSALGNSSSFEKVLEDLGAILVGKRRFIDHHFYKRGEVEGVLKEAEKRGANWVMTTEKDEVKLSGFLPFKLPMLTLRMRMQIKEEGGFWRMLEVLLGKGDT